MANAFLKVLQNLEEARCPTCAGKGTPPNGGQCSACHGSGFAVRDDSFNRQQLGDIVENYTESLMRSLKNEAKRQVVTVLEHLITSVRAQAVEWAWTEARNQYDRGLDVRQTAVSALLRRAEEDLNPAYRKEDR